MKQIALLLWFLLPAAALAQPVRLTPVRAVAGESRVVKWPEGSAASVISVSVTPPLPFPPGVTADPQNNALRVAIPPATRPGTYRLEIHAADRAGRPLSVRLDLTVDRLTLPRAASGRLPVVLMNGFQLSCSGETDSTLAASEGTFGQLATLLQDDGAPVSFFNNCAYGSDVSIEALAGELGAYLSALTYSDGTPVPQVDLVAHSMGGLIARAYLAGLQPGLSFAPPADLKVHKLVLLATPNFGSFEASLLGGVQTDEMTLGSQFLWNLATWNQRGDDLRGVDALAVIGNGAGDSRSDGVVSLTSASLGFARADARTRIVPYCHITTDSDPLIAALLNCSGQGIADINSPVHSTALIVRSFLADTQTWMSIGTPPSEDPNLSQYGGIYFAAQDALGRFIADASAVIFGSASLSNGGAAGTVFFDEFAKGAGVLQAVSASLGAVGCGSFTEPPGFYTAFRCKSGPAINSVTPSAAASARVVASGAAITIAGSGFGAQCSSCAVMLNPGGTPLQVSSWTDTQIAAELPPLSGAAQIVVNAAAGSDSIEILAAPPPGAVLISSVANAADNAPGAIAPGEIIAIKGSGLGPASGVSYSVDSSTGTVGPALAGTSVTIGGVAAPILYSSDTQVNAIVPYEIAGQTQTSLAVSYQGAASAAATLAVASAAPAVFALNPAGTGEAAAANQDGSYNGAANPAAKGSYVTLYFTGGGETNPPGVTGSVTGLVLKRLTQAVTVTVGGDPAEVAFAGAAPEEVDGVLQLDIRLADDTPSGPAEPLVIEVGGVASPPLAALAVK